MKLKALKQNGFSLLEIMLALSLLMVILLVSLRLLLTAVVMTKTQYFQTLAMTRVESLMALKPVWSPSVVTEWRQENARLLPEAQSVLSCQHACCEVLINWQYAGIHRTRGVRCW